MQKLKSIDEKFGILSLADAEDNLLLWAHYADEHKGAAIEIDVEDQDFIGAVFQEARLLNYTLSASETPFTEEILMEHFFTKSRRWEYEREFRIVRRLEDSTEVIHRKPHNIHLFDLPSSCLKRVIFGQRFETKRKQELSKQIRKTPSLSHICLAQARMDDQEFKLNIS